MKDFRKTEWFGQPVIEVPTYGQVLLELSEDDLKQMLKTLRGEDKIGQIKDDYKANMVTKLELSSYLGVDSFEINRMSRLSLIISVPDLEGNLYPLWQFDSSRKPFGCIREVIDIIGVDCQWTTVQFLKGSLKELDGLSPIRYLNVNGESGNQEIIKLCRRYYGY